MMAKQLKTPADEEVELRESFKVSLLYIEREASERMKSVMNRTGSRGVLRGGGSLGVRAPPFWMTPRLKEVGGKVLIIDKKNIQSCLTNGFIFSLLILGEMPKVIGCCPYIQQPAAANLYRKRYT